MVYPRAHRHARRAAGAIAHTALVWLLACSAAEEGADSAPVNNRAIAPGQTPSSNLNFGGAQDVGFFRDQLEAGVVPTAASLDAPGFFAEHHIELPPASCGQRVCLQPMVAVMGNLMTGSNCTMLHLGLNSPIAADPGERPPLSLAVVVDVSGSMGGEKIAFVREGLSLLIDGMRDEDRLAIVTYSDGAAVAAEMGPVGERRVELRRVANSLVAAGSTNLSQGLVTGYEQVHGALDLERQNRVILLSDGVPTVGTTSTAAILEQSRGYNSDGVGLTTIGLGTDFNLDLMRGLAQQADGNFYFVENAAAVDEVFTEELSFFVVPVAFDLELSLTAGPAYDFGRALGAPLWQSTDDGGSLDVPSVFVAHRESAQDVTEAGGRRGGGSSLLVELMPREDAEDQADALIATVEVSYRDPGEDGIQRDEVELRYPYAPSELLREGHFESESLASVHKSFVMLNIFVGMQNAVVAFHSREFGEGALAELDNLIAAVEDYNEEIDDRDIVLDLELLEQLRANLIRNSALRDVGPPLADDEAWPVD